MMTPFLYPLCDRTVTVYGMERGRLVRQVLEGCYYEWKDLWKRTEAGPRFERKFLLILPGKADVLLPGWRVLDGIGPQDVNWAEFLPVTVPTLSEVEYVKPWYFHGRLCHTEAGRK